MDGRDEALSLPHYLQATRRRSFNVVMVVGLLAVYEGGLILADSTRRNAADVLLKDALGRLGPYGVPLFHLVLFSGFVLAAIRSARRGDSIARYVVPFLMECATYAALLAPAVLYLRRPFLAVPVAESLLLDVGAGVYEEIVFRLIVIRGLFFVLRMDPWQVFFEEGDAEPTRIWKMLAPLALVIIASAAMFAAYHHLGDGAESWAWGPFLFRGLAGLLLSLVYFWRGLAVAVYTHALYDLFVHLGPR